jgi:tripartite-type tricarboxylate transporter receptor subunit TctC
MPIARRGLLHGAIAGALFAADAGAQAGSLRIVVPFSAGSGSDNSARVFAEALRQSTGRNVIVGNKAGGGTTIGSQEVSRSKPDGSTLLFTTGVTPPTPC